MSTPSRDPFQTTFASAAWAALRIVAGLLFAYHGAQKLFGVYATHELPAAFTQIWFGGVIEFVAGLLVAIGFCTRLLAFLASGTMAVAYMQFHWKFAFADGKWLPAQNQGELAVVYCFVFFAISAIGAGRWSVDELLARRKK